MDLSVSQSYESCMKDEGSARQQLIETWSKYTPQDKSRCVGQTEDGGVPGYVEVVECLLVTIRVIDLADFLQHGRAGDPVRARAVLLRIYARTLLAGNRLGARRYCSVFVVG
jgi:hypothetical protein